MIELVLYFIAVLLCLLFQGFFSGSETALISVEKMQMRQLAQSGNRRAKDVEKLLSKPEKILSTTLVGTNIFLVLGSVMATKFVQFFFPSQELASLITTIILTPLILIFAELIPKSLFLKRSQSISLKIVEPLKIIAIILYPLVKVASFFTAILVKILGGENVQQESYVTKAEISFLLKEGEQQGVLGKKEHKMIRHAFKFSETDVKSIMVPLVNVVVADANDSVENILTIFEEEGFSQIPIYEERVDNVVGIVTIGNLLDVPKSTPLIKIAEDVFITPENRSIESLLYEMRDNQRKLAVAVDEYGGVTGILTIEDIVEEIVGEIEDEYSSDKRDIVKDGKWFIVSGDAKLEEVEERLSTIFPDGDYVTLSGMITNLLGRIPEVGEFFVHENLNFLVLESTDRVIKKVRISFLKRKK